MSDIVCQETLLTDALLANVGWALSDVQRTAPQRQFLHWMLVHLAQKLVLYVLIACDSCLLLLWPTIHAMGQTVT